MRPEQGWELEARRSQGRVLELEQALRQIRHQCADFTPDPSVVDEVIAIIDRVGLIGDPEVSDDEVCDCEAIWHPVEPGGECPCGCHMDEPSSVTQ